MIDCKTYVVDDSLLRLTVPGRPVQQGSKTIMGKRLVDANSQRLMPWREKVASLAADEWGDRELYRDAVAVTYVFRFARPKSHYGTGRNLGVLKASAPQHHKQKPDIDKLVRAVNDALTGVVWHDDAQVCQSSEWREWTNGSEGVDIVVRPAAAT